MTDVINCSKCGNTPKYHPSGKYMWCETCAEDAIADLYYREKVKAAEQWNKDQQRKQSLVETRSLTPLNGIEDIT